MSERHHRWMAGLSAVAVGCFSALGLSFVVPSGSNADPVAAAQARASPATSSAFRRVSLQGGSGAAQELGPLDAETAFREAIAMLEAGAGSAALNLLQAITHREPDFRPARPVFQQLQLVAAGNTAALSDSKLLRELAEESRIRLASEQAVPPAGAVPNAVLQLAPLHRHLIVADLQRARLYVLENRDGALTLVRHHYASMGKNGAGKQSRGDHRTPIGIYHITRWLGDRALPELYGAGAWPTNYPNPWDQFRHRTGDGIWLHGVPRETESRAPRSSRGCVTMANDDLLALKPYIDLGSTPVVFSNEVDWLMPEAQREAREEFLGRLESWRRRWSARDTDGYLAFYGDDFTTEGMNKAEFVRHKQRVNSRKKFIEVQLSDISLYRYPGTEVPLLLAEFDMDYRSDDYRTRSRKQQFWKRDEQGVWKIFREENL